MAAPTIEETFSPAFKEMLNQIEDSVVNGYTLADAMREGSSVTKQAYTWGSGSSACALSAAGIAAKARGII